MKEIHKNQGFFKGIYQIERYEAVFGREREGLALSAVVDYTKIELIKRK